MAMAIPRAADAMRLFEDLRRRRDALVEARIRNQADKERAERDLRQAEAAAIQEFGTSDENALLQMIEQIRESNAAALQRFAESIEEIETNLLALEQVG